MKLFRLLPLLWGRFRTEAKMVWAMLANPATPPLAKLVAVLGLLYLISPMDILPDLIPILGWVDDGVIVALFLSLAYKLLPPELYEQLRRKSGKAAPNDPAQQARDVTPERG
jgi:uncharacterized membrane protein YkvA (DUF1232 family)